MRIRFGEFELDSRRFLLRRAGEKVALRPKVFDLLVHLAGHRDRVVPRAELVSELWGETRVGAGSLSGLVNELRRALGESGRGPSSIRTVHARGYQFVARVEGAGEGEHAEEHGASTSSVGVAADGAKGLAPDPGMGGVADALDRVRLGLGRVLSEGPRVIVVESGADATCSAAVAALPDRALQLARHLGFDSIRVRGTQSSSEDRDSLSARLLSALIERRGLPAIRAELPAEDRDPLARHHALSSAGMHVACPAETTLASLLRRLAIQRPILLVLDGIPPRHRSSRRFLAALLGMTSDAALREEAPILVLAACERSAFDLFGLRGEEPGAAPSGAAAGHVELERALATRRVERFRLVASERTLLDRWLRARGIDPLPKPLADALLHHLSGRGLAVEVVLERLAGEGEPRGKEPEEGPRESCSRGGSALTSPMRQVRPDGEASGQPETGTG